MPPLFPSAAEDYRQDDVAQAEDDERVIDQLALIDGGDHQAFIGLARGLSTADYTVDIASMPGWRKLSRGTQARITAAARSYLSAGRCDLNAWVDDPSIIQFAAHAGYRLSTLSGSLTSPPLTSSADQVRAALQAAAQGKEAAAAAAQGGSSSAPAGCAASG